MGAWRVKAPEGTRVFVGEGLGEGVLVGVPVPTASPGRVEDVVGVAVAYATVLVGRGLSEIIVTVEIGVSVRDAMGVGVSVGLQSDLTLLSICLPPNNCNLRFRTCDQIGFFCITSSCSFYNLQSPVDYFSNCLHASFAAFCN